jgi:hypothetical protein
LTLQLRPDLGVYLLVLCELSGTQAGLAATHGREDEGFAGDEKTGQNPESRYAFAIKEDIPTAQS